MIIGYVGTRGRGKTLSCVREAYEHYLKGYSIYSNIKLNTDYFKTYEMINLKDIIDWVKGDKQFKKAFFILDEVHIYLDSRSGMSKKNVILSYFVLQTRKRDVRVGYTTQFLDQVDKRLRQPTEVLIQCQNYLRQGKSVWQKNLIMHRESGKSWYNEFYANDFFNYYNTDEIVNPFKDN